MAIDTTDQVRGGDGERSSLPAVAPEVPDNAIVRPPRPAYKQEEGAPDKASEWWAILRALLYAAVIIAVLAVLLTLWRAR
ncbi:hypothetical protein [Roseomonas sp. BN140053]|uniref:hypothetical protein n=1 Tax=Roseomonas sp. BN140053 TaxID=3391898 RepID=UPI0039E78FC4